MNLRKPKSEGSSKLKEMQEQILSKNRKKLESIAGSINFKNVPSDPVEAAVWVAETIDKFTTEVPVLSGRSSANSLSRSQTPSSKGAQGPEEEIEVDFSKIVTDEEEEKFENKVRNAIRGQRERLLYVQAIHIEGDGFSKKKWLDQQYKALDLELDQKIARSNFRAIDSFDDLSGSLFVSPKDIKLSKDMVQRNELGNLLLKVLCCKLQPGNRESVANLKLSLANVNKDHAPLLEAFKVLAGSKLVMGQLLSVFASIEERETTEDNSTSPTSEIALSTPTANGKTSHPTSCDAIAGQSYSVNTQEDEGNKQIIATQKGYYIEATKILIEMANREFHEAQITPYGGLPMFAQFPHRPPPDTYNYSSPYPKVPIHLQIPSNAAPQTTYDSPYADPVPNGPCTTGMESLNPSEAKASSLGRTKRKKRLKINGPRKSNSRKVESKPVSIAGSEEAIESQKDLFEKTSKIYPQTLNQIDALLTMANGGILPGSDLQDSSLMEVDDDATESDSGAANNHRANTGSETNDDEEIKAIVDRIVDEIMEFRDWQATLPPGTYRAGLYNSAHGLHLVSELKRLVTLARPLINLVVHQEVAHHISVFYQHLSARTNTPKMLVPAPPLPYSIMPPPATPLVSQKAQTLGFLPAPEERFGEKRKRK